MNNEIDLELKNVHLTYPVRKSSPKSIKRLFSIFSRRKDEITSTLKDINLQIMKGEVIGILGTMVQGRALYCVCCLESINQTKVQSRVNGKISLLASLGTGFQRDLQAETISF